MGLVHLDDTNFQKEILEANIPALVDFYTTWCGPCKLVSSLIEELAKEYQDRLKMGKLNVEEAQDIAARYSVMSVPTLLFFKDGQVIEQIVGALPKQQLKKRIDSVLS